MKKFLRFAAVALCLVCAFVFVSCSDGNINLPPFDDSQTEDNVGDITGGDDQGGNIDDNQGDDNQGGNVDDDQSEPTEKEYFRILTLEDGKTYAGSSLSFDIAVYDEEDARVACDKISFSVDLDANDETDDFVALSGDEISIVWNDNTKTSYKIRFTQGVLEDCKGTPILFRISVSLVDDTAEKTFRMTYTGAEDGGYIGDIVLSIEGFTVGYGYFAVPQYVAVYDGEPFAKTFTDFVTESGWTYSNTGSIQRGFYLEYISGIDVNEQRVSASLAEILTAKGFSIDDNVYEQGTLGEFDFTYGSGWMYSVNGTFPNYGMSDYFPQDGDIVRVVFTLAYGSDVGGGYSMGSGGSSGYADFADYKGVMNILAYVKKNEFFGKSEEIYSEALKSISVWNAPQATVDLWAEKLTEFYA